MTHFVSAAWASALGIPAGRADSDTSPDSAKFEIDASLINRALRDHANFGNGSLRLCDCFIKDHLDLHGLSLGFDLYFERCVFEHSIIAIGFEGQSLHLDGSILRSGMDARDATLKGNLFLRNSFASFGPILIRDAIIDRILDCTDSNFHFTGDALGLKMHHALSKQHEGQAFGASRVKISTLFWRNVTCAGSYVSFRNARIETFRDDLETNFYSSWDCERLDLIGFSFQQKDFANFDAHKAWLELDKASSFGRSSNLSKWLHSIGEPDQAHKLLLWARRNGVDGLTGMDALTRSLYLSFLTLSFKPLTLVFLIFSLFLTFSLLSFFQWGYGEILPSSVTVLSDQCFSVKRPCTEAHWLHPQLINHTYRIPENYPRFDAFSYALEKTFPFFSNSSGIFWATNSTIFQLIEFLYSSITVALQALLFWSFVGRRPLSDS